VDLLGSIQICTLLDGVQQSVLVVRKLQSYQLLGCFCTGTGRYDPGFETSLQFDEIKFEVGPLVSTLNSIKIYSAFVEYC
jgi:hypothetical protein